MILASGLDLTDLRDYHDWRGEMEDRPQACQRPEAFSLAHSPQDEGPRDRERLDTYSRRIRRLMQSGRINPDGSWNPTP